MAFVTYEAHARCQPLRHGYVRVWQSGQIGITSHDLAAAGIADRCTVLMDPELRRIALRAPRDDEPGLKLYGTTRDGLPRHCQRLAISGVLAQLGVAPPRDPVDLPITFKDQHLLIIDLPR